MKREGIDCELEMTGQLILARSRGGQSRLAALSELLAHSELPCEQLDSEALAGRIRLPANGAKMDDEKGPAALRFPAVGILHPVRLLAGLAERITAMGGKIVERARVASIGSGSPVRLALQSGGEVLADEVVVATAGYTPALGLLRGRVLPGTFAGAFERTTHQSATRCNWLVRS